MKTLKEKIEVMQAGLDGKILEFRVRENDGSYSPWSPVERWADNEPALVWDWQHYDFRIKVEPKKPREVWLDTRTLDNCRIERVSQGHAESCTSSCPYALFREVLPE